MRPLPLLFLLCLLSPLIVHAQVQPPSQSPAHVAQAVHPPVPTFMPEAQIPDKARFEHRTGGCLISLIVDAKGIPQDPQVVSCSDPMFGPNSVDAVRQYRFKPAVQIADGQPVPVKVEIAVVFRHYDRNNRTAPSLPPAQIRYGFASPPGMDSLGPDSKGVYPLAQQMEAPKMKAFASEEFEEEAMLFPDGVTCHALLTLSAKGKAVSAQVLDCDHPLITPRVVDSLLQSKFKPARLNGKAVPVRMTVLLAYAALGTHQNQMKATSPASKP